MRWAQSDLVPNVKQPVRQPIQNVAGGPTPNFYGIRGFKIFILIRFGVKRFFRAHSGHPGGQMRKTAKSAVFEPYGQ